MRRREERGQLSFLCECGEKPIELKTLGWCRSCYDRRYRSVRFFGGLRERVLARDGYGCRVCGARSHLVVHHRVGAMKPSYWSHCALAAICDSTVRTGSDSGFPGRC
jgi:hypothetical protein